MERIEDSESGRQAESKRPRSTWGDIVIAVGVDEVITVQNVFDVHLDSKLTQYQNAGQH